MPSTNVLFMDLFIAIRQLYQHTSNFKEKVYEWHSPAATHCQGEARRFMKAERQAMRWIPNRTWWFGLRRPGFMVIVRVFSEAGRPFKRDCTLKVTKPWSSQSKHLNCHLQGKILIFLVMVFSINFHHWQYYLWAVKSFNLVLACCTCILIVRVWECWEADY